MTFTFSENSNYGRESCKFEFSLKVKVMGSNPGYLLKSFLLYCEKATKFEKTATPQIFEAFSQYLNLIMI